MSFSAETKIELCRLQQTKPCCLLAQAYGALLLAGVFSHKEIRLSIANEQVVRHVAVLLARAFDIAVSPVRVGRKYVLQITQERDIKRIFNVLGYDWKPHVSYHLNRNVVENDCCAVAFLRGVFLIGGTVASPDKKCHLELRTTHRSLCREMVSLMLDMGLHPKLAQRDTAEILYFKDTNRIEDFLTLLGASVAAMRIMEAKVEKGLRNTVNRQVNCETANMGKTADAAAKQVAAIRRMLSHYGWEAFPEALQETAQLRLAHPEASLTELTALFSQPISKPGLNHRLRKITTLAEALKQEDNT